MYSLMTLSFQTKPDNELQGSKERSNTLQLCQREVHRSIPYMVSQAWATIGIWVIENFLIVNFDKSFYVTLIWLYKYETTIILTTSTPFKQKKCQISTSLFIKVAG